MNLIKKINCEANEWAFLRQFTSARIALGKTGVSIPLQECLRLKQAHAQAKDAVYSAVDKKLLLQTLTNKQIPVQLVHSKAANRDIYLQRPDLGRSLSELSVEVLSQYAASADIVIVIADGLSAVAVNKQAAPVTMLIIKEAKQAGFSVAPVVIAEQGRVAIADEIGELLKAKLSIILIGERPGLTSSESMGAYITYQPKTGTTDERRNCISNIKDEGLTPTVAAVKIMQMVKAAFAMQLTGVVLKESSNADTVKGIEQEELLHIIY